MSEHRYRLKYKLETEAGSFTREQIEDGGTDALMLISCLHPEDGSYSQTFRTMDGRTDKPMAPKDIFKAWMMLGAALAQKEDLDEGRRVLAETVIAILFNAFVKRPPP